MNYYTAERNTQMLLYLLKAHGVRKIVASPGTTNMCFVYSIQQDGDFEIYSAADERSAAYMACGLAAESGEPVAISCTGATASRNYMPGLTEAFYRKLPILAITSTQPRERYGNLIPQFLDRSQTPKDIVKMSVYIPSIHSKEDEWSAEVNLNRALLELRHNGGGPVHINLETEYKTDYSVKVLPKTRIIRRIQIQDQFPKLRKGKIGIFVGAHKQWSLELTRLVERFCQTYNAVVLCDQTSNYKGKYGVFASLITYQSQASRNYNYFDLLIHIGDISGAYMRVGAKEVWRVCPSGEVSDTFRTLTNVFEMEESSFFKHYQTLVKGFSSVPLAKEYEQEYRRLYDLIPELPFSNIWAAKTTALVLPKESVLHLAILHSLRSWNFFEVDETILGYSNTGGFGIDGCVSSLVGAALANPDKLYFGIIGDLAFFYDMNVLGNRHVGKNVRIMLLSNGCGVEFKNYDHLAYRFGDEADYYIAAKGHYGNQSPELVKNYAETLGFLYLSAHSKEDFHEGLKQFVSKEIEKPIVFELFVNADDESDALKKIRKINENNLDSYLQEKYDVAVTGCWTIKNYGVDISYYALFKVLKKQGKSVIMVERRIDLPNYNIPIPVLFRANPYPNSAVSRIHKNFQQQQELNNRVDCFVLGSDSIWCNGRMANDVVSSYALDYVEKGKKRIAYSTSLGRSSDNLLERVSVANKLKTYDGFSADCGESLKVYKQLSKADSTVTLDPILLCEKKDFAELLHHSDVVIKENYIFLYTASNVDLIELINLLTSKFNREQVKILHVSENKSESLQINNYEYSYGIALEDWLAYLINSNYVITDSYYTLCLAILFQKPFFYLKCGDGKSVAALGLLQKLGLEKRIVENRNDMNFIEKLIEPINYKPVIKILENEKKSSLKWLMNAIDSEKKVSDNKKIEEKDYCREERYQDLIKIGYSSEKAMQYCEEERFDIVLTGCWSIYNYGGALTYYSFFRALQEWGYSVLMVERRKDIPNYNVPKPKIFEVNPYPAYAVSGIHKTFEQQKELNSKADTFILGSDQVLNGKIMLPDSIPSYLLDYTGDEKKKVAYAASFGNSVFAGSNELKQDVKKLLGRFNAISVRENSGIKICKEELELKQNIVTVIDPIFLCDKDVFDEIMNRASHKEKAEGAYLFSYLVRPDKFAYGLDKLAEMMNYKLLCVLNADQNFSMKATGFSSENWPYECEKDCSLENWLYYFAHSKFVVTDSFHAVCLSIIFKKPFVVIKGETTSESHGFDRLNTILGTFHLEDRVIKSIDQALQNLDRFEELDYEPVYAILEKKRKFAIEWLKNAIND